MGRVSQSLERVRVAFDDDNLVANAGLLLPATLIERLGVETLIDATVRLDGRVGGAAPGRKVLTLMNTMLAGGSHIDHADVLRSGASEAVVSHRVMAPSTLGTFLRSFTFGHVRQLEAVSEYVSPSEHAQLDEITAIDNAKATEELQSQIALLTVAQTEAAGLTDQVATLETALAEVTAERDALLASASTEDGTTSELQTDLDDANAAIAEITTELDAANANLEAATAAVAERDAAIETIQGQLDTTTETLEALNVLPVPSYINGDIDQARTDAEANGWTLIEEPTIQSRHRSMWFSTKPHRRTRT